MTVKLVMIACVNSARAIGKNNELLYLTKKDMAFFKQTTTNGIVIMGRNTYCSIPEKHRPLENRINIVLSQQPDTVVEPRINDMPEKSRPLIRNDIGAAIREAKSLAVLNELDTVFVMGGAEIYHYCMSHADSLLLTEVLDDAQGDSYFPVYPTNVWMETSRSEMYESENRATGLPVKFQFVNYVRRMP